MYLWNIAALKNQLSGPGLSESDVFKYVMLLTIVCGAATVILAILPRSTESHLALLEAVLMTVISMVGTFAVYRANGGTAGSRFAERFLSLGLVAGFRLVSILLPLVFVVSILLEVFRVTEFDPDAPTTIGEMITMLMGFAGYYLYIAKSMRDVATSKS